MPLPQPAVDGYRTQQAITATTVAAARRVWSGMDGDFDTAWAAIGPRLVALVAAAQQRSATEGAAALTATVRDLGLPPDNAGDVDPAALAGVASDGRPLDSLLYGAVVDTRAQAGTGADIDTALTHGQGWLDTTIRTALADAARAAAQVALASHHRVGGYIRMLNPPSCSRCAVLAGRFYRWNAGFRRHPACDCRHVPASEDVAGELTTDPRAYFTSLSARDQDRIFTRAGAEAIRHGADISQVVNARRSAAGLSTAGARVTRAEAQQLRGGAARGSLVPVTLHGKPVYVTTEGTTRRGLFGAAARARDGRPVVRLMPETILDIATDRDDAIRLLRRYGYLR